MTNQVPVGCDCMFVTPPLTGTAIDRLSRGQGKAIAWPLYL